MKKTGLILLSLILIVTNLLFGSIEFNVFSWYSLTAEQQEVLSLIIFENRFPRTLLAFFAGASCAVSGLVLQTIFKNPLAGPTTLGVNSGASLGIVLYFFFVSSLGFAPVLVGNSFFAILGSLLFLALIIGLSLRFKSVTTVLIVGMLIGYVGYSFIEVVVQSSSSTAISNYVFWGMGSFNGSSWSNVLLVGVLTISTTMYFIKKSKQLNLYLLGDNEMLMSGGDVKRLRIEVMLVAGAMIGILTSVVGPLAFLGIAVPNLLKLQLKTLNHHILLPFCVLIGGAFAVLADLLSRGVVFDAVFPLNAILSLLAIPVVLILFYRKKHAVNS
ncbi:MAG: iron complex transport system permease protein [Saprospiraceae bacterium]|jgi:iron complex transport system permease protein